LQHIEVKTIQFSFVENHMGQLFSGLYSVVEIREPNKSMNRRSTTYDGRS